MADVESFFGADDRGEAMDPAAFERFKERMAAASAQLKTIAAQEQKQKKKEDELVKILLKFIKTGKKRDIMLLVLRLLEQNVPAAFIVSLLLISNTDIQQELGIKLLTATGAQSESKEMEQRTTPHVSSDHEKDNELDELSVSLSQHDFKDAVLPLKVKIAVDNWAREIIRYSEEYANRILQTVLDQDGLIKLPVIQLAVFCLRDYLQQQAVQLDYDILKNFIGLMLEGIIKKIKGGASKA